jgi:hypothetical protein
LLPVASRDGGRQASFRDVLANSEFRAIYAASTLSWLGDYVARAAITAMVYQITDSVVATAAAFAISYAPWLIGGPILVSLAERYPYRSVMVCCDVARMAIMAVVAIPGLALPEVLALLLACALLGPPFDAARSATLPSVLSGDRYVVAVAVHGTTAQPAQVAGYLLGAALAARSPQAALLINAATFGISALLVRFGVRRRRPALDPDRRTDLLEETVAGFRLVFATPTLRALALIVFCGSLFVIVPEGLGAVWAARLTEGADGRGLAQGMIMAAVPLGWILGALGVSRLVPPSTRRWLIRPLAVATPLALVPALLDPPAALVALLAGVCGFAMGGLVPVANGLFVQALPSEYRARAFGVVQGGLHLLQGGAVLLTGALAQRFDLPVVIGLWGLGGICLMVVLSLTWPSRRAFQVAFATAALSRTPRPVRRHARATTGHGVGHVARHVTGAARAPTPARLPGTMER